MSGDLLAFALIHYIGLFVLAVLCYGLGRTLTTTLTYHSVSEEIAVCTGLGLGVLGCAVFALGLVGLLTAPGIAVLLGLVLVGCFPVWTELFRMGIRAFSRPVRYRWLVAGGLGLAMLSPVLVLPLYPPTAFDATMYHLALAKLYAQTHNVPMTPYIRFGAFPHLNEMLFALSLSVSDDITAQLIQLLMLLLVAVAVFAWGQRIASRGTALFAAALWLATPMVIEVGTSAMIDVGVCLFVTLATYCFYNWAQSKERPWLIAAGAMTGFAIGSKYSALVFLGALGLATVYHGIRDHKWSYPLVFGLVCGCVGAPWYLYNYVHTGNPVFPFLTGLFGYSLWNQDDIRAVMWDLMYYGTGRTLWSFVCLPWTLVFDAGKYHLTEGPLSPVYVLTLPIGVIFGFWNPKTRGIVTMAVIYILYWFLGSQVLRYLIPCIPLLCLITALVGEQGLRQIESRKRWAVCGPVMVVCAVLLCIPASKHALSMVRRQWPVPVTQAARDTYYENLWPPYSALKFLNERYGQQYTLYALDEEHLAYLADGTFMGDAFGPARFTGFRRLATGSDLYGALKQLKATHFLFDLRQTLIRDPAYRLPQDDFFDRHFKLVYARAYFRVFQLEDSPVQYTDGPQLLQNPGFDKVRESQPEAWALIGAPTIDASREIGRANSVAAKSQGDRNAYYQRVAVEPGALYRLGEYARADESGQKARLQINWSDAQGNYVGTDIQVFDAGPQWMYHEMAVAVPAKATFAAVFASAAVGSSIWYDDMSFAQIRYGPE